MNRAMQCGSFRCFHRAVVLAGSSQQAKVIMKLMQGTTKKKPFSFYSELPSFNEHSPLTSRGNSKVNSRRIAVLNSIFLEKVTDILSTCEFADSLSQHGFFVTRVKYASDASALNVYWGASSDLAALKTQFLALGGLVRHQLSELHYGKVPHVNFVYDGTVCRAADVEELLRLADYGPDYVPSFKRLDCNESISPNVENLDPICKKSNILGVNREAIMTQVLRSMRRIPAAPASPASTNTVEDVQRQIDFKKYVQAQKILMEKKKKKEKASRPVDVRQVDLEELKRTRRRPKSEVYEWDEYLEDDFIDEDVHSNK